MTGPQRSILVELMVGPRRCGLFHGRAVQWMEHLGWVERCGVMLLITRRGQRALAEVRERKAMKA